MVALMLWVAGLVGVVLFVKHDWAAGPSLYGDIHRAASFVAFLSLPAGALLAAAPWLGVGEVATVLGSCWACHGRSWPACWMGVRSPPSTCPAVGTEWCSWPMYSTSRRVGSGAAPAGGG
jgi:hypothetical protein